MFYFLSVLGAGKPSHALGLVLQHLIHNLEKDLVSFSRMDLSIPSASLQELSLLYNRFGNQTAPAARSVVFPQACATLPFQRATGGLHPYPSPFRSQFIKRIH